MRGTLRPLIANRCQIRWPIMVYRIRWDDPLQCIPSPQVSDNPTSNWPYQVHKRWNLVIDYLSNLIEVRAWRRQTASHYLKQCCPCSTTQCGIIRPQELSKSVIYAPNLSIDLLWLQNGQYISTFVFKLIKMSYETNNYNLFFTIPFDSCFVAKSHAITLPYLPLVPYIYVSESDPHWFR